MWHSGSYEVCTTGAAAEQKQRVMPSHSFGAVPGLIGRHFKHSVAATSVVWCCLWLPFKVEISAAVTDSWLLFCSFPSLSLRNFFLLVLQCVQGKESPGI